MPRSRPSPSSYEDWTLSAEVNAIIRDQTIRQMSPRFDGAGTVAVVGTIGLSFVY